MTRVRVASAVRHDGRHGSLVGVTTGFVQNRTVTRFGGHVALSSDAEEGFERKIPMICHLELSGCANGRYWNPLNLFTYRLTVRFCTNRVVTPGTAGRGFIPPLILGPGPRR